MLRQLGKACALGILLLAVSARAECTLGTGMVTPDDRYEYQSDLERAVRLPLLCDVDSVVTVDVSSSGGRYNATLQRYEGRLQGVGGGVLLFYIPSAQNVVGASRSLRANVGQMLEFMVRIPREQWGAPTSEYSTTLSVTVTF